VEVVGREEIHSSYVGAVAAHAVRTGDKLHPDAVTAEVAAALMELANLASDEDVIQRLQRAIEVLEPDNDECGTREVGSS
jgi:hypothetical protein